MTNKNVLNYIDPDGKTNKRIVQAPGGASSLSLAWQNQKIDYGPSRYIKNINNQNHQYNVNTNSNNSINNHYDAYGGAMVENYNSLGLNYKESNKYELPHDMYRPVDPIGSQYGHKDYNPNKYSSNGPPYYNNQNSNIYNSYIKHGSYNSPTHSLSPLSNLYDNPTYNDKYINQQINAINYSITNRKPSQNTTNTNTQDYNNYNSNSYNQNSNNYNSYNGISYSKPTNRNGNSQNNNNTFAYDHNYNGNRNGNYNSYLQRPDKDQLDIALNQQYHQINHTYNTLADNNNGDRNKNVKPSPSYTSQQSQYQYRPSIKINGPPPMQYHIGNPDYNYWKDNQTDNNKIGRIRRTPVKPTSSQSLLPVNIVPERTSVKVHYPPGGRQTLTLG